MAGSLHDALEETLGFIQRALDRIRADDNAEAELHNVRAYLVNVLELVERDPGVKAASDDLFKSRPSSRGALTEAPACLACLTRRSCGSGTGSPRLGRASGRCRWA
jgi:hypothetical protein